MRCALLQLDVRLGDVSANMAAVERHVRALADSPEPPDVITLPELWSTGYALEQAAGLASPGGGREADFLGGLARRFHVAFAGGSVLAREGGQVFNRAQVIGQDGRLIACYDKIHLFRPMGECRWLAPGTRRTIFTLGGMRCACVTCYDIRFPELARRLALEGAETLFVAAEWPASRIAQWEILLRARAVEDQMHVVACNRCGTSGDTAFGGGSLAIAPDGTVLARGGEGEERICASLDPAFAPSLRGSFPVLADRVPRLY